MSSWGDGYVTDMGYTSGFHREMAPAHLAFAAGLKAQSVPDVTAPLTYCDLGCGQGVNTNLLAAAYPHIEFHANDFNPAHVVGARRLAAEAGSTNVHFYEDSFEEFISQPKLPEAFDIIALHGIYSWVSPENRAFVRRCIAEKLKPGGLVYLSYNALPGWSALAPIRRLMQLHNTGGGSTAARLQPALDFVQAMHAADAGYFKRNPGAKAWLDKMVKSPPAYLAHEYFNENWTLFYHADVVREVDEAKLNFVGTATVIDTLDAFNVTPAQTALLAKIADPVARETARDYATCQQFRRDLFVKGATPLSRIEADAQIGAARFALTRPRAEVELGIMGALGLKALSKDIADPIVDALAQGPKTADELMQDPRVAANGRGRLIPTLTALMGASQVMAALPEAGEDERRVRTDAFNAAVLRRARVSADLTYLASPLGGGFGLERIVLLFVLAHVEKHSDPGAFVWEILKPQGQRMTKDGAVLDSDEDNIAELRIRNAQFVSRLLPMLQGLKIV
jgi:SAM-dependent methyltransferase